MLIAKLAYVMSEKDHYENGCTSEFSENSWKWEIQAENEKALLAKIANSFYRVSVDNISINPCGDEPSRLDVQITTAEEFFTFALTEKEFEEWKTGKIEAFNTSFTFFVFEEKPFTLSTI
jgi:hypothetical protein